jgi:hypothetical protein
MATQSPASVSAALVSEIDPFIAELLACCPMIRSIWLVADSVNAGPHAVRPYTWDLIAFADPLTLQRLRRTVKLQRRDVRLRVLDDANRLEAVWAGGGPHALLLASDWEPSSPGEGYYTESHAPAERLQGADRRTRRKAICVWQGIDPLKGPGS